jgi:hypothetical protein
MATTCMQLDECWTEDKTPSLARNPYGGFLLSTRMAIRPRLARGRKNNGLRIKGSLPPSILPEFYSQTGRWGMALNSLQR